MRTKTEAPAVDTASSSTPRKLTRVLALRFGPEQDCPENSTCSWELKDGGPSTVDLQQGVLHQDVEEPENFVRNLPSTLDTQDIAHQEITREPEKLVRGIPSSVDHQDIAPQDFTREPKKLVRERPSTVDIQDTARQEIAREPETLVCESPSTVDVQEIVHQDIAREPEKLVRELTSTVDIQDIVQQEIAREPETAVREHPSTVDIQDIAHQENAREPEKPIRIPIRELSSSDIQDIAHEGIARKLEKLVCELPSTVDIQETAQQEIASEPENLVRARPSTVDIQDIAHQEFAREPEKLVRELPSTVDIQDLAHQEIAREPETSAREHPSTVDIQHIAHQEIARESEKLVRLRPPTLDMPHQEVAKEPDSLVHERSKNAMGASSSLGSPTSPRPRSATEGAVRANGLAKGMDGAHSPKKQGPFRYGPERFFYDRRTYTGVHKKDRPGPKDPEGTAIARQRSLSSAPSTPRGSTAASEGGLSSPKRRDSAWYGPERFFYEERTYTGVHKRGGPETLDLKASGQVAHLSQITRPNLMKEPEGAAAARQRSRSLCSESPRGASTPRHSIAASEGGLFSPTRQGPARYGPKRFFYESSTYTGVWKNGGPTVLEEKKEEVVNDISEILRPNLAQGSTGPVISSAREQSQTFESLSPTHEVSESYRTTAATKGYKSFDKMGSSRASIDSSNSTGNSSPRRYGPERFFYDSSSYTGAHKSKVPNASDIVRDDGDACDFVTTLRPNLLKDPEGSSATPQRSPWGAGVSTPRGCTPRERAATEGVVRSRSLSISPKTGVSSSERLGPGRYGPERFFYDTSTYAGVHKSEKHVMRSKRAKDTTDEANGAADGKWLNLLYGQQS